MTRFPKPDWQTRDKSIRLYCGDCLNVLPKDGRVDAVVTDPPYGVRLKQRITKHSVRRATTNYEDGEQFVINEIIPRAAIWIASAKSAALTPGIRMLQCYPRAADIGGVFQPNGAGCGPWGFTCFHPVLFFGKCPYLARCKGSRPTATRATNWMSENVDHPCPKPVEFMQWMVERASWLGDVVADPFMGSGTTAIACISTGRSFIGIEKEKKYFDIAVERIKRAIAQRRRDESPNVGTARHPRARDEATGQPERRARSGRGQLRSAAA